MAESFPELLKNTNPLTEGEMRCECDLKINANLSHHNGMTNDQRIEKSLKQRKNRLTSKESTLCRRA